MADSEGAQQPDRTTELLELVAELSAQASRNERQIQALLAAVVRAASAEAPSVRALSTDSSTNDDAHHRFLNNILLAEVKALMQQSADFDAACKSILEGMSAAARAHDYKGAANAFLNFQRCMSRPRPEAPIPEP